MDFMIEIANLIAYLQLFVGKSDTYLFEKFGINTQSKSKNFLLASAMCYSYKGKGLFVAICKHENLHVKTIQLRTNGKPKEAMSFAPINYDKLIIENWDSSAFKSYISGRFIFFVFRKCSNENKLEKIFMWKMSEEDLEGETRDVWERVKQCLIDGTVFKRIYENGKVKTNFPAESETNICHVRPHGQSGLDVRKLPSLDLTTGYKYLSKQSFWFNHKYLEKILKEG